MMALFPVCMIVKLPNQAGSAIFLSIAVDLQQLGCIARAITENPVDSPRSTNRPM
jgi:hypothetical protein